ncbi:MAG: cupredoxin domain-containing protein [Actinomycetota bacterium]|nr:cupredoxin domain-containing protein [Actinomycetota bacterium]
MTRALIAALAMSVALVGCETPDPEPGATPTAAGEETTTPSPTGTPPVQLSGQVNDHGSRDVSGEGAEASFYMELDNFYFEPTFVKAAPGATLRLELGNEGTARHSFTMESPSVDETLEPGQMRTVEVRLPSSGVVNFVCKFHRDQGMQGAFYFQEGSAGGGAGGSPSPRQTGM